MARLSLLERAVVVLSVLSVPTCAESVAFTNSNYTDIAAGSPFPISWSGDGTEVTIQLLNGPSSALQPVLTVAKTSKSPYSWTPSSSLAAGTYALSITQSGITNYSPIFEIAGGTGSTSSPATGDPSSAAAPLATAASAPRKQATPTPEYVANGGLNAGSNNTWPYVSGTGLVLPTGASKPGQYAAFEGVGAGREYGAWAGVLVAAAIIAWVM